ncbi:MAG: hypothetical protein LBR00_03755 [Clostridiales Family XIII bacterium]|nr:hypothetical protein [Clostridiales Family XIII bacterium]
MDLFAPDGANNEDKRQLKELYKIFVALRNRPEEIEKIKAVIERGMGESISGGSIFPTNISPDPDGRGGVTEREGADAPEKESNLRPRSVRVPDEPRPHPYLKTNYINDDDEFICQICEESVFTKRDGSPSFDAVLIFSNDVLKREHQVLYLGLCQICAEKYKEYVKNNGGDGVLLQELRDVDVDNVDEDEGHRIPITLDERSNPSFIHFTHQHVCDIHSVLSGMLNTDRPQSGTENPKLLIGEGERVVHDKFGPGTVVVIDTNYITVQFDKEGEQREFPVSALANGMLKVANPEDEAFIGVDDEKEDASELDHEDVPSQRFNLISEIENEGIAYEDKRDREGCLWILGGQELRGFVEKAKTYGYYFEYKEERKNGGPGWWTK